MKKTFYSEMAYICGIITIALGTAFMERADYGVSMVVAPAYLVYLKISSFWPSFTFGMAEYSLQALLLLVLAVVMRSFKFKYLFSFVTAFIYGNVLDAALLLIGKIDGTSQVTRVIYYVLGLFFCALGVSFFFHTYLSPEAYELFVKEISSRFGMDINKTKTIYDITSASIGVLLSFSFFGLFQFRGVKAGTIICALVNGYTIGVISRFLEKHFEFKDALALRKLF